VSEPVDLLIHGDTVVTMNGDREQISNGAVVVDDGRIVAVTSLPDAIDRYEPADTLGGPGTAVIPGLVNAHQHLTGDRLLRSTIPDTLGLDDALMQWALPAHTAHTPDYDELSATLALVEGATNGITYTVEAGTVAHPDRVLAAFDTVGVGGTLGSWGWDADEVLARQQTVLDLATDHPRVDGWVTLVGHDLMSDELVTAASELACRKGTGITFHMSPSDSDAKAYLARTGRRPFVHLDDLGVLGDHVLVAHAVHIDDAEVDAIIEHDVAVASCPWAYLRLGQGITQSFRHQHLLQRGARLSLGCDSENAGDSIDVLLAARLFAGLMKDSAGDPTRYTAAQALALATIDAARAIKMDHEIGSLEVGKRADVVVVDTTGPIWTPHADDPVIALIWAAGGRTVRDVVASGRIVVSDGNCTGVDIGTLAAQAQQAHQQLVSRCGANPGNK
jgi:5-methylthioadenosine/S-adenosylhomocysteine deaminase